MKGIIPAAPTVTPTGNGGVIFRAHGLFDKDVFFQREYSPREVDEANKHGIDLWRDFDRWCESQDVSPEYNP